MMGVNNLFLITSIFILNRVHPNFKKYNLLTG
jgi:hypothetical protein